MVARQRMRVRRAERRRIGEGTIATVVAKAIRVGEGAAESLRAARRAGSRGTRGPGRRLALAHIAAVVRGKEHAGGVDVLADLTGRGGIGLAHVDRACIDAGDGRARDLVVRRANAVITAGFEAVPDGIEAVAHGTPCRGVGGARVRQARTQRAGDGRPEHERGVAPVGGREALALGVAAAVVDATVHSAGASRSEDASTRAP